MAIALTKELLSAEPEALAKKITAGGKDTSTQIRRFYNDFLILKTKADCLHSEEEFQKNVLPLICFSKAKIAYALGREVGLSKDFADAINNKVDQIETRADFDNFINYYQALIGYAKYYENNSASTGERRGNNNQNYSYQQKTSYMKGGKK